MLEAEGSSGAPPLLPLLAGAGARIDGLRLLDGTLIAKIEQDGRAWRPDGPMRARVRRLVQRGPGSGRKACE